MGAGPDSEVRGLELERDVGRRARFSFRRRGDVLAQPPQPSSSGRNSAMSLLECGLGRDALRLALGLTDRSSMPRASRASRAPSSP